MKSTHNSDGKCHYIMMVESYSCFLEPVGWSYFENVLNHAAHIINVQCGNWIRQLKQLLSYKCTADGVDLTSAVICYVKMYGYVIILF